MSLLITGSAGFVGRKAIDYFLEKTPFQIYCLDIAHAHRVNDPRVHYADMNLMDADLFNAFVREHRPRRILHLAGLSSVSASLKDPAKTLRVNVQSGLNLLEAVRLAEYTPRMVMVSSSEVYGIPDTAHVVRDETHPVKPESPYAVSKTCLEWMGRQYAADYGIRIIIARPFNHTGPGQSETFVLPGFAKRLMEIKHLQKEPVIYTGNIDIERDFLNVNDVLRAYHLLLEQGRPTEAYNICSGGALPIRWMLEEMVKMSGVSAEIRLDLSLTRKNDIPVLTGSHAKITAETGWKPEIPFKETLKALLDYWEARLKP